MSSKNDIDDVSINTDRIIEKNDNQSIITSGEDILSFLNIDFDTLQVALDNFKQANDKLEICLQTSFGSGAFSALTSPEDFISAWLQEVNQSILEILEFSQRHYDAIISFLESYMDKSNDPELVKPPLVIKNNGSNSNKNSSTSFTSSITTPTVDKEISLSSLSQVSLGELNGFIVELKNIANSNNVNLCDLLSKEEYADKIKEVTLKSQYIPDDIKELLMNSDSKIVQKSLASIMSGNDSEIFNLNSLNLDIIKKRLENVANANDITINQLLTDDKYTNILKEALGEFEDVSQQLIKWDDMEPEEYQKKLLSVYDGDQIDDVKSNTINIIRDFTDYISDATDIVPEELLVQTKYADVMKKAAQEFAKSSIFISASSNYSNEGISGVIKTLFY